METLVYIYGLKCPIENEILYVGKSKNPEKRLLSHLGEKYKSKKNSWLKNLKQKGLIPELVILDTASEDKINDLEKKWIEKYKAHPKNKNMAEGGTGGFTGKKITRYVYTSCGKKFESVKSAGEFFNRSSSQIIATIKQGRNIRGTKLSYNPNIFVCNYIPKS